MKTLSSIAAISPLLFLALCMLATILAEDFDSKTSTLSRLAGPDQDSGLIFQSALISLGILIQPLGFLLFKQSKSHVIGWALWLMVFVYSLGCFGTAIFRVGFTQSKLGFAEDSLHHFFARIAFLSLLVVIVSSPFLLRNGVFDRKWKIYSIVSGIFILALASPFFLEVFDIELWWGVLGLLQRSFVVITMTWVFLVAIKFRKRFSDQSPNTRVVRK